MAIARRGYKSHPTECLATFDPDCKPKGKVVSTPAKTLYSVAQVASVGLTPSGKRAMFPETQAGLLPSLQGQDSVGDGTKDDSGHHLPTTMEVLEASTEIPKSGLLA